MMRAGAMRKTPIADRGATIFAPIQSSPITRSTTQAMKAQVGDLGLHLKLVAGAGFEPATFGL